MEAEGSGPSANADDMYAKQAGCGIAIWLIGLSLLAQDATVAPLMRLLQSGRLPKERQPQVLEMICQRGGSQELAYVFEQVQDPEAFEPALRGRILDWLADAAAARNVVPETDLSGIGSFLAPDSMAVSGGLQLRGVRLAALWKVESLADELAALASDEQNPARLRHAAIAGLADLGNGVAHEALAKLAADDTSAPIAGRATAGLVRLDLDAASQRGAQILASASRQDDLGPMLD